jgi:hypothetical protein
VARSKSSSSIASKSRRWISLHLRALLGYGTLGFELFRDYLLTLDYPQNQLASVDTVRELRRVEAQAALAYWSLIRGIG